MARVSVRVKVKVKVRVKIRVRVRLGLGIVLEVRVRVRVRIRVTRPPCLSRISDIFRIRLVIFAREPSTEDALLTMGR